MKPVPGPAGLEVSATDPDEAKAPARARSRKAAKAPAAAVAEPETVKAVKPARTARTAKAPAPAKPARAKAAPRRRTAAKAVEGDAPAAPAALPEPAAAERAVPEPVPAPAPEPPAAPAAAAPEPLGAQAQAVLQAIREGRAVELLFVDPEVNPPRTFEPRQLIFDTFARDWYVWGWDRRYNAERHHLLGLVAQVNPVEGMGRAAQGPYKEGTPANLIGGWLGGEPIRVKVVLLKQWIFAVRQAPAPFPEFTLEDQEEGKALVSFVATDLRAITRWAMQFGDGIQVLEPQRLLDRIKQVGLAWAGKSGQAAPAQAQAQTPKQPAAPSRPPQPQPQPRPEHRPEHRFEPAPERKSHEAPKPAKPAKFEIRIDRL
jgi:predicted DNA-binding transcriptional regulator YafY